jgi:ribokinase
LNPLSRETVSPLSRETPGTVCVVGSINLDTVFEVERLPRTGETLAASAVRQNVGGKGANQAVAASRAGAVVALVARIGADDAGRRMRDEVARFSVEVTGIRQTERATSGSAFITVDDAGENMIVIDAGANGDWADLLGPDLDAVATAALVVLQHEVPAAIVEAAAVAAIGRVILNAAPARLLDDTVLRRCDPLVVNETELALVSGAAGVDEGLRLLIGRGARSVVVTLGSRGARWVASASSLDGEGSGDVTARVVRVVDSTGAGDALVGMLAARLAAGATLAESLRWAVAAATLSVQARGTHSSYPSLLDVAAELDG